MGTNTDWGANFASASIDAMTAYDDILVPRRFDDWAETLLDRATR
jgi:F420-0:gamma-glutamyl ligase